MKIKGTVFSLVAVAAVLLLFASSMVSAQEQKIKMDEYKAQLAEVQQKEADAGTKAATLLKENEALKLEISGIQGQIDAQWAEVYALLGVSKAEVQAFGADLDGIGGQIDALGALSPEELFRRKAEIADIEAKIAQAKGSKIANLSEMEGKLAGLDAKLAALKAKVPSNIYDQYTVLKGDYLWKISKKEEIYNDPYQWIRIYCVNKDQIKNPDLINPDQILKIARGVGDNEYLVVKGDYLKKIAGQVLSNPTQWTKLYEANKDIITNKDLIFPYQVLTIPKE